jgi:predicted DNA-binding WGR domain protein
MPCWKRFGKVDQRHGRRITAYNSTMRLFLQQRPQSDSTGREALRFVQLQLEADLIGGWTLTRESGQVGGRSTLKREQYLDHTSALAALERARDQTLKKGFQLMFAQGVEAPN